MTVGPGKQRICMLAVLATWSLVASYGPSWRG